MTAIAILSAHRVKIQYTHMRKATIFSFKPHIFLFNVAMLRQYEKKQAAEAERKQVLFRATTTLLFASLPLNPYKLESFVLSY